MLWGSSLAAGAEAFRRYDDRERAVGAAIATSQRLVASFTARTGSADCREITGTDFLNKLDMLKYMFLKARHCFDLAEEWAPEAIRAANEGLSGAPEAPPAPAASCASELARRMGATEEQAVMVAGFAGGIGLSGHGCGALGAAVWLNTLAWSREQANPRKSAFKNPAAVATLEAFQAATGGKMRCEEITGRRFETAAEHTEFVRGGGCESVIDALGHPA
jgi:hypothetical protein